MDKIPVLLMVLLQLLRMLMTASGQLEISSCREFTYFKSNVTHKVMGKILIPNPPKDQEEYHLELEIAVGDRIPDSDRVNTTKSFIISIILLCPTRVSYAFE